MTRGQQAVRVFDVRAEGVVQRSPALQSELGRDRIVRSPFVPERERAILFPCVLGTPPQSQQELVVRGPTQCTVDALAALGIAPALPQAIRAIDVVLPQVVLHLTPQIPEGRDLPDAPLLPTANVPQHGQVRSDIRKGSAPLGSYRGLSRVKRDEESIQQPPEQGRLF